MAIRICFIPLPFTQWQLAAEHRAPADRLNRGIFDNQIRALCRTTSQRRTHQPAVELYRSAGYQCSVE